MSIRCRLGYHDISNAFTQPEPRFERRWNDWLQEPMLYEIFDHKCARCGAVFRHWRWTREAIKMDLSEKA